MKVLIKKAGGVALSTLAIAVSTATAAPVPGGTLDPLTIPKYVTPLVIPPVLHDDAGAPMSVDVALREISQQEAEGLQLLDLQTSPDGVAVEWDRSGGDDFFFIFGSRSSYGYYLTKGNARQKVELINDSDRYYYGYDLHFLGWIQNP